MAFVRILVVDDSESWRSMIFAMLQDYPDWQIICEASDGWEAVQKSKELQPDLILLDISLPRLNGIDAARQIYRFAPSSKVLFLSENRCPSIVLEAFRVGARGYVVKSDAAHDLVPAMEAVIGNKQFVSSRFAGSIQAQSSDA